MAVYKYNPNRGTNNEEQDGEAFTRTAVKARMYHPDGSFWNGNQTIIRFQQKLGLIMFALGGDQDTRVVNTPVSKATGSQNINQDTKIQRIKTKK